MFGKKTRDRATALAIAFLAASGTPCSAASIDDCNQFNDPKRQIRVISGCTSLIGAGSLQTDMLSIAYTNRGVARANLGRVTRAIADFTKAIELNPKNALASYNRGNAYLDQKRFALARADYTAAIASAPGFALAYFNRGLAEEVRGERDACVADYQMAVHLDPTLTTAAARLQRLGVSVSPPSDL